MFRRNMLTKQNVVWQVSLIECRDLDLLHAIQGNFLEKIVQVFCIHGR